MPIPITKDFAEKLVNQPLTDVEVSPGCAAGDNIAGALKALKLTTAPGETLYLVHKTFSDVPMFKNMAIEGRSFPIEVAVYSQLVPQVQEQFKSRLLPHYPIPVPKFYAGFSNDDDDYLTLEDLRPSGYRMADKYSGLTLAEVKLALKNLAIWHASTYFLIRQKGESWFDSSPIPAVCPWIAPERQEGSKIWLEGLKKNCLEVITAQDAELGAKVAQKFANPNLHDILSRTILSTDSEYFPCIIHGDLWVNNIMFKYNENNEPVDSKFIDFQQTRRGNIYEDLQNFFWTSTTPLFRKEHLYSVLNLYFESFVKTLADLKCPMPLGFSRGKFIDGFSMCAFPGFIFAGFAVPMQLGIPHLPGGPPPQETPPTPNTDQATENSQKSEPKDFIEDFMASDMMGNLKCQLENSPAALKRYMEITREFIELDPR